MMIGVGSLRISYQPQRQADRERHDGLLSDDESDENKSDDEFIRSLASPQITNLRRYSVLERRLIGCVFILSTIVLLSVSVILYSYFSGHLTITTSRLTQDVSSILCSPQDELLCPGLECVEWSGELVSSMEPSVDPCKDFYQYSCAYWINHTQVPAGRSMWSQFSKLGHETTIKMSKLLHHQSHLQLSQFSKAVEDTRRFYTSCMNTTLTSKLGVQPLVDYLKVFGHWPTLGGKGLNVDGVSLQDLLTQVHLENNDGFFSMSVSIDDRNNKKSIITFDQSGLGMGDYKKYLRHTNYTLKCHEAYVRLGVEVAVELGAHEDQAQLDMEDVLELETLMAKIFVPTEITRDPEKAHHYTTVQELQEMLGDVLDVKTYMTKLFSDQFTFTPTYEIDVNAADYFRKLSALIEKTPKRTILNYIFWQVAQSMLPYLGSPFNELLLDYQKVDSGTTTSEEDWIKCVRRTEKVFTFSTGALYVTEHFNVESKEKVSSMIETVVEEFKKVLRDVDWMDKQTRGKALDKATRMTFAVGYPEWILNAQELDLYYKDLNIDENDSLFENKLKTKRWGLKKNYERLQTPKTKEIWGMNPLETNAYYSSNYNHMVFPAGILQPPFYHQDYPDSFNYGSLMFVIGHELTHGFDKQGKSYDGSGNMSPWWEDATLAQFTNKSVCMAQQYSSYQMNNQHANGNITLDENIADNGGLKLAFRAFQRHVGDDKALSQQVLPALSYNALQLFFIKSTQNFCEFMTSEMLENRLVSGVHSINAFRVRGMLSNFQPFADAFNCIKEADMNPRERCEVW